MSMTGDSVSSVGWIEQAEDYHDVNHALRNAIDYKAIGRCMRIARKQCGFTQAEISELMRISPKYYARYESGGAEISLARLIQFIRVTRTPADILLRGCIPQYPDLVDSAQRASLRKEIDVLLDECSEEKLKAAQKILSALLEL